VSLEAPPEAPPQDAPPRPPRLTFWQTLRGAPMTTFIFAVCVAVFVAAERTGSTKSTETLLRFGAVERGHVWDGQYWRLATSMFLHIGAMHLFWNAWFGFKMCATAERELGPWRFVALYLGSGIVGAAASVIGHDAVSAGASGALFGLIGWRLVGLRVQFGSWRAFGQHPAIRQELIFIGAWFLLGAWIGFDNYAHGGGMLFGALFTWALTAPPAVRTRRWAVAIGIGALLVAASLRPLPVVHASAAAFRKATRALDDPAAVLRLTEPLMASRDYRDEALNLRARAFLLLNRFEEARQAADEVVQKHPKYAWAYGLRGIARFNLGDAVGAEQDLDKAVELDPAPELRAQRDWLQQQGQQRR